MPWHSRNALPPWPWADGVPKGEIIRRAADVRIGLYAFIRTDDRVYARDENGRAVGGEIARYHWKPALVHGETKVSWLVGSERYPENATRYPKKPREGDGKPRLYGLEEVEDQLWLAEHAYRLSDHIRRLQDAALLQRIAQMTGYDAGRRAA